MKKTLLILFFVIAVNSQAFSQCWKSVSAGYSQILAIAENGTLWAWGKNTNGELGDGTNINRNSPVQIGIDNNWKEVSAGMGGIYAHTLAIKTDGTLWAWGYNGRGQLGIGTIENKNYPVQVGTETNWKTVATGLTHSIGIKENGTLWGWGSSESFALTGFPSGINVLSPEQRNTDSDWVKISAHDRVNVAIKTDNTAWGWGHNISNMLSAPAGTSLAGQVRYPVQKVLGTNIRHTSTGNGLSYDIKLNNILTLGGNTVGGTNPIYVKDADVGDKTVAVIKMDNTLWFSGIILGGNTQVPYPFTQLGTANNWKSVNVGNQCAAAIDNNGDLWVWGWNYLGQLGNGMNGSVSGSTIPLLVPCPSALSSSDNHLKLSLQVYPNPVQDKITIESNAPIDRLQIIDILGKHLVTLNYSDTKVSIDVTGFTKGIYFVQVFSGSNQSQIKFIKN